MFAPNPKSITDRRARLTIAGIEIPEPSRRTPAKSRHWSRPSFIERLRIRWSERLDGAGESLVVWGFALGFVSLLVLGAALVLSVRWV